MEFFNGIKKRGRRQKDERKLGLPLFFGQLADEGKQTQWSNLGNISSDCFFFFWSLDKLHFPIPSAIKILPALYRRSQKHEWIIFPPLNSVFYQRLKEGVALKKATAKPFFNDQPMLGEIEMRLRKQKKSLDPKGVTLVSSQQYVLD